MTKVTVEFRGDNIILSNGFEIRKTEIWSMGDDSFSYAWNTYYDHEFVESFPVLDYSLQDVVDRALEIN